MKTTYFIEKVGIYGHGVYFITHDKNEAIERSKLLASNDIDDYHGYIVYEYVPTLDSASLDDGANFKIYSVSKSEVSND